MLKLTKEILQERSNIIHNSEYEILGEYVNSQTCIDILHKKCGTINKQLPANHLSGKKCKFCVGRINTKNEFQEKSNIKWNNEFIIIGEYIDSKTHIEVFHKSCGMTFSVLPNNHLSKRRCKYCNGGVAKTIEKFQQESNIKWDNSYDIIGNYINIDTYLEIKHKICNHTFKSTPKLHMKSIGGGCVVCFNVKSNKNTEITQQESNRIHDNQYVIQSDYIDSKTPLTIYHKECGKTFSQLRYNHIVGEHGCTKCGIISKEILQQKSNNEYGNEYLFLGEYIDNKTHIEIKHIKCGHIWNQTPNKHFIRGCPKCRKSKGEQKIEKWLINNNILYETEKTFNNCVNKNKLRFDFYLYNQNLCVEYNGIQHYKVVEKFGGLDAYNDNILRDAIKNKYCDDNNIKLLIIKYTDFNNIDNILNNLIYNTNANI